MLRSPETFAKDPRRWNDLDDGTVPPDSPVVPMMMYRPNALFSDGEEHRRLRGAITDSLARVDPNALRGYVERSADTLIDRFAPTGKADLLGEYAQVLPLLVFNQLFGCPAETGAEAGRGHVRHLRRGGRRAGRTNCSPPRSAELVTLKRRQPGAGRDVVADRCIRRG